MTIASTTSKVSYNGSGSNGPFPITYKFTKNADISATKRSSAGVETVLALTTDYTLTGAGDAAGGALTLTVALAVGESLVIARAPRIVQEVDYVENSAFPAETHESALDLLTTICQSLQEQVDRSVKVEISSTTSPDDLLAEIAVDVAGAAAAVDAAETAQGLAEDARDAAIAAAASVPTFGAFGLTLAATTTASNARAALELGNAATLTAGTAANNLLQLDGSGKLPAVSGENLTNVQSDDSTARDNAAMTAFLAWLSGSRATGPVPGGGVYTLQSNELTNSGATYDATGDYYTNAGLVSSTKYNLTAGMITLAGFANNSLVAELIDGAVTQVNTFPVTSGAAGTTHVKIIPATPQALGKFRFYLGGNTNCPALKVQYTDDGTTFYDAGGVSGTTVLGWNEIAQPNIGNKYGWRVINTNTNPSSAYWNEIECYMYAATSNMQLTSAAVSLGKVPTKATVYLLHKAIDAAALGTDIKVSASRGGTFAEATDLTTLCQYDADYKLLRASVDLSALPGGYSVAWRAQTFNAKAQRVRAALLWAE